MKTKCIFRSRTIRYFALKSIMVFGSLKKAYIYCILNGYQTLNNKTDNFYVIMQMSIYIGGGGGA